ncbi:MAG: site-2 protease family protein [Elusimicrobia bacterium]|nr:site-2 protease family protein [Elusimicrobiota bacterium]
MDLLIGGLGVVFAFGLVVFVHEFGHFIVAKKSGVRVDRFSFGLGPEMFGFQWGETRYCVAWIPLGGEVRMAGEMEPGGDPKAVRDPREFFAKPWYRRIPIVVAGPAMNYVLAYALFSFVFLLWGNPQPSTDPVVGDLVEGFPAKAAGLQPGDRFLTVDGKPVAAWSEVAGIIHLNPDRPIQMSVRRPGGGEMEFVVTPRRDTPTGQGLIGISPVMGYAPMPLGSALMAGGQQTVFWTRHTLSYLGEKIVHREKPDLAGPIGIATVISKSARSGIQDYLFLIALISLGIGLFNLFPIPMLDGGHLVFFLWEGIFRRPVTRRAVQAANAVGLSLLLGILVFATYSDIQRMRVKPSDAVAVQPK